MELKETSPVLIDKVWENMENGLAFNQQDIANLRTDKETLAKETLSNFTDNAWKNMGNVIVDILETQKEKETPDLEDSVKKEDNQVSPHSTSTHNVILSNGYFGKQIAPIVEDFNNSITGIGKMIDYLNMLGSSITANYSDNTGEYNKMMKEISNEKDRLESLKEEIELKIDNMQENATKWDKILDVMKDGSEKARSTSDRYLGNKSQLYEIYELTVCTYTYTDVEVKENIIRVEVTKKVSTKVYQDHVVTSSNSYSAKKNYFFSRTEYNEAKSFASSFPYSF